MNLAGMATTTSAAAKTFSQTIEAEFCSNGCDYVEYALYDSGSTDEWKNDKTSFLVRKGALTETWTFKLFKNGVIVATIAASTYGEYYDFASLLYSDLKGMVIYWKLVAAAFGNGDYTVRIEKTFNGVTTSTDSHIFRVVPYSFEIAKGTVRVETYQNGTFVGTGFTYRGMSWFQSMRMQGIFWDKQPKLERTEYFDSSRQRTQVWDKTVNTYKLELRNLPAYIGNAVLYDQVLANEIYITDYNVNYEVYRKVPVRIQDYTNTEYYTINTNGNFELAFNDRAEGTIKGY